MKLSDYVIKFISDLGVHKVFCVTGGGAMHLNNSLGCSKDVEGVFMLHEQGASIAAESYARIREGYGVCLVTSGPGATNAITGLCGAYMDSIPVIFISGQAKRADLVGDQNIRQFGIQEVDIISMVKPYSKYAVRIMDSARIKYELEKAAYLAASGRPGAVWIDIPLDIQASDVDIDDLKGFVPDEDDSKNLIPNENSLTDDDISSVIDHLNSASRPALILGNGVRLAHASEKVRELIDLLNIPVFTSWNGVDLIESDHPLYFGRPNIVGHRSANLILQSADFVLSIGTRLSLLNTGYNFAGYLQNAFHVMVDIDENEMNKKSLHPQMKICADVGEFIGKMAEKVKQRKIFESKCLKNDNEADSNNSVSAPINEVIGSAIFKADRLPKEDKKLVTDINNVDETRKNWLDHCRKITEKYPVQIPEQQPRDGYVSLYKLFDVISDEMSSDDIYQFTSSGTSVDIGMKVLRLKKGQRAFLNKSMAAMGYDVPACIGSCIGSDHRRVICVTGDGSIAMNLQELEIIKRLNLPVKIFVADNCGYSMIWHSQSGNFKGHLTGCTEKSGLTLPDMKKVAEAFGIHGMIISSEDNIDEQVRTVLDYNGPVVCVVKTDISQKVLPKQSNYMDENGQMQSRPLQDMTPLLDRDELEECMKWQDKC